MTLDVISTNDHVRTEHSALPPLAVSLVVAVLTALVLSLRRVWPGPVFAVNDPEYEGVRIPKQFWKVAVLARGGRLFALGFMVSQEALLRDVASFGPADVARTFQVPIRAVAAATGLGFGAPDGLDAGSVADFAPENRKHAN